jgi:DNA-binding response OmpR family regulator
MNGTVEVESREGKGTVFMIRIPVTRKAPKEKSGQPAGAVNGAEEDRDIAGDGHIDLNSPVLLIVEDNKDVADYIASCIDSGYQIIFARNGDEGIEKAVKYIPDIIITDLLMPDKDGLEMCNTLKNGTATSHIPIIMLTARSLEQDKLKGYSAGADAYLIKPFNKKELLVRIKQLTELRKKLQQKYSGLAMQTEKPVSLEDEFLNTIFSMIDKNIDDTEYKSAILARDMGLSESQLYRKIKAITNVSTAICIRNFRLEKAKEMLKDCTLNISEIAYRCGFNDPAWFAHAFKEKYKVSPSEYRS